MGQRERHWRKPAGEREKESHEEGKCERRNLREPTGAFLGGGTKGVLRGEAGEVHGVRARWISTGL